MTEQHSTEWYQERIEHIRSVVEIPTPEQRAALDKIDRKAKDVIAASAVMDVAGVVGGVKPVAFLSEHELSASMVQDAGLNVSDMGKGLYAASRDPFLADALQQAVSNRDSGDLNAMESHRQIGNLLGYPDSSTDYFVQRFGTVFQDDELPLILPKSTKGTVDEYFHQMILSPDNYKQELLDYAAPLQAATRELAPHSYAIFEKAVRRERVSTLAEYAEKLFKYKKPKKDDIKIEYVD